MDDNDKEIGAVASETPVAPQQEGVVPRNEAEIGSTVNETGQIVITPDGKLNESCENKDEKFHTETKKAQAEAKEALTEAKIAEAEIETGKIDSLKTQNETDEIEAKTAQSATDSEKCTTEKVESKPEEPDEFKKIDLIESTNPSQAPQKQLQPETSPVAAPLAENISATPTVVETSSATSTVVETSSATPTVVETSSATSTVVETSSATSTVVETSSATPTVVETGSATPTVVETSSATPKVIETGSATSTAVADISVASTTAEDFSPAAENAVSALNLAPPSTVGAAMERRGSTEKKSNFLRQFRCTSSASGFRKFTASQFMEVWNHYDTDGNGLIEDHELDGFLREFVLSSVGEGEQRSEILSEAAMFHFKETFMDAFDENQDGMIDIAELAEILPTDENFLLLFHLKNPLESSVEFMRIWREYDRNCNGYIESKELKSFLKHMLHNQKTSVSDEKLEEYTETILNLFDANRDGKLQLSEMARLMPVKHNILSKPILKGASCITRSDIDRLFRIYDQNKNGTIEDEELSGMLKDLMDLGKKDYTLSDIEDLRKVIMEHWDLDHDGTISKSELRMFLIQQCKMSAESQGIPYDDDGDDDDDDFDD